MDLRVERQPSYRGATFGNLTVDGEFFCHTLEDQIREVPGHPVHSWKVKGSTAIPAGRYRVSLEVSPRFGPDTITVHDVPGFVAIRIHGGNDVDDTEGCPLVGSMIDREAGTISGARSAGVLDQLRELVREGLAAGEVWLDVVNPA